MSPSTFAYCALLLLVAAACQQPDPTQSAQTPVTSQDEARDALLSADRAFAAETGRRGLDGWMSFFADDAVRLRMGETVARGPDAIRAFDSGLFADTSALLVWTPTDAGVFDGGTYGFTTGRAAVLRRVEADTLWKGQYVTLWRRGAGGWEVILDTGS